MTDNEIIKDFEKEIKYVRENEKYDDFNPVVDIDLCEDILDLINRQKAENESLKVDLAKFSIRIDNLYKTADEIKSEAINEFAERLKENINKRFDEDNTMIYRCASIKDIDNLVKEMAEVSE